MTLYGRLELVICGNFQDERSGLLISLNCSQIEKILQGCLICICLVDDSFPFRFKVFTAVRFYFKALF